MKSLLRPLLPDPDPVLPRPGPCEGVDYSFSRPNPACLVSAGKLFAVRYVGRDPRGSKDITASEAAALESAGMARVIVYQPRRAFVPTAADDGARAAEIAFGDAALAGMPAGRPVYFAVDGDTRAGSFDWRPVEDFFRRAATVVPVSRLGAYGGENTVEHLRHRGLVRWLWQTYAWSDGQWVDVNIRQRLNEVSLCGGQVDLNRAMLPDYGQW